MMASRNRHHYVPRFILERFADADGLLHVHDRRQGETLRRLSPRDTFVEKHLYSSKMADGSWDRRLEAALGFLEGPAAGLTESIAGQVRAGRAPRLTPDERGLLDAFIYLQFRRVPDLRDKFIKSERFDIALQEAIAEFEERFRVLSDDERQWIGKTWTRDRLKHNAFVKSFRALQQPTRASEALSSRGIALLSPESSRKQFVIGSRPVIRVGGPRGATLDHPDVEVWFAIAPDVAVGHVGAFGEVRVLRASSAAVRRFNQAVSAQSTAIASSSAELVTSLRLR